MDELKSDGYSSYLNLISCNLNIYRNFVSPLGVAIFYTFFYPIIRNVIAASNEWVILWGNRWNLRISKEGTIKVSRYLELRENANKLSAKLTEVVNSESETKESLNQRQQALEIAVETTQRLRFAISEAKFYNSVEPIKGNWLIVGKGDMTSESIVERIADDRLIIGDLSIIISIGSNLVESYTIVASTGNIDHTHLILRAPDSLATFNSNPVYIELSVTFSQKESILRVTENGINQFHLKRMDVTEPLLNKFIYMPTSNPL